MDEGSPLLEVGFSIETNGAFAEILRFAQLFDDKTVQVVRQAAEIERATGGMMKLGGARAEMQKFTGDAVQGMRAAATEATRTAAAAGSVGAAFGAAGVQVTTFANAATRETQALRREAAQTERSIEGMIKALDRETAAVGRSRDEQRSARIEALALAAARQGNTDAADRLLTSTRALDAAQKALAEDKLAAEIKATAAAARERGRAEAGIVAQLLERSRLEAAIGRIDGSSRPTAAQGGATFSALAERERLAELAERQLDADRKQVEQVRQQNNLLAERAQIEAALERTTGVGRTRATDGGATFSALAARAAEEEAAAQARVAAAAKQAADEHARLAAMVRGSQAAQMADAEAAERLRSATDPLYAATKRLNAEIAESTRLYHAGATAPAEYARQQQVLADRLRDVGRAHDAASGSMGKVGASARLNRGELVNLGYQLNDVFVSLASGQKPLTVFIQQGAQIGQIAAASGVGLRGMAASVGALLLPFAPLVIAIGTAAGAFALFNRSVSAGVDTKKMIDGLGLTRAEIKRLENTSVTSGDVIKATFQVLAQRVGISLGNVTKFFGEAMNWLTRTGADAMAGLYAGIVGTFDAIGIAARGFRDGKGLTAIMGDIDKNMTGRFNEARGALNRFGADVSKQVASNKLADLTKQANELKLDRTPKTDRHAEQLAREAEAMERQIAGRYELAAAYGVSGEAALIAEARAKAETSAIMKRGDAEQFVARQIRLAIAERVADAAKSTAAMRDQAAAQELVNRQVADGNIPTALAAQMVRDRITDLPLLAAIEAARHTKDAQGLERATQALEDQRAARDRLTDAEKAAQIAAARQTGNDRLEELREEMRLIGATDAVRVRSLAILRATQEAARNTWTGSEATAFITQQADIASGQYQLQLRTDAFNDSLRYQADLLDIIADNAANAARGMADAFGEAGRALGDTAAIFSRYVADQQRLVDVRDEQLKVARQNTDAESRMQQERRINGLYAARTATQQVGLYGDMTAAAKGFFKEGSTGWKALHAAEQAFRVAEFAMSVAAMFQNSAETVSHVANAAARASADGAAGIAAQAKLPFPANLAAMAATAAALVAAGIAVTGAIAGGGKNTLPESNKGTGTVLGDSTAQSESIKRAVDQLREVDTLTNTYARQMTGSLRSIDSQIGGLAAVLVRSGDINASSGVTEGFKTNTIGSILGNVPIIGGLLSSLFGSKTTVIGSGLYGRAQSVGDILAGGFDASTYSDIEKKKKFLGITTGTKYSTQYGAADPTLENQFTLILRSFNDAIAAAAAPLGQSTRDIQNRLNGFVVNIGKIDLKGLTGTQIQEKLEAVFGAAADNMANAAFPGIARFQKVGEGAFETLVRVASTVEAVTNAMAQMGGAAASLSVETKLALADQFDSIGDLTSAVGAYFDAFYTPAEQAAAKTAELTRVFDNLGLAMPGTLAGFRSLVEAQNLNTEAGRTAYATLLQLAPAFADLKSAMDGAKSAADILAERQDLERKLLELNGDTAAIRALDLAKLDASNRALQEQIYAIQDAQEAAKAADELRKAWSSVGDSIMDEVKRIRGLNGAETGGGFATLMSSFNAATTAARAGDMDAAKSLPGLSQALLAAAAQSATSRQELDRVQAQTAASLEATQAIIARLTPSAADAAPSPAAVLAAVAAAQPQTAANDQAEENRGLREEIAAMRSDINAGLATVAREAGRSGKVLERVSDVTGGDAFAVADAA